MKRILPGSITHDWGIWIDQEVDLHAKYDIDFIEERLEIEEQIEAVWYGIIAKLDSGIV